MIELFENWMNWATSSQGIETGVTAGFVVSLCVFFVVACFFDQTENILAVTGASIALALAYGLIFVLMWMAFPFVMPFAFSFLALVAVVWVIRTFKKVAIRGFHALFR